MKAKIHCLLEKARTQDDWMTRLEENASERKLQQTEARMKGGSI